MNSIIEVIDKHLTDKRESETRDNSKFRVSDAGRCRLMRYWKRQGKPASNLPDTRTQRVFEVGHIFHHWIQDVLAPYAVARELRVEDEHRIGHIDLIATGYDGLILYDLKTVHSKKFHYNKNGNSNDLHYAMQVHSYVMLTDYKLHDARIAYVSKDDLCIQEISIYYMYPNIGDLTMLDWTVLFQAWQDNKEPDPNPMSWECKYCIYQDVCKEGRNESTNHQT